MLGYRFEDIEQEPFVSLIHPEDAPHALSLFKNLVSGKIDGYHNEKRFRHKKGRWVWVRMSRSVIRDKAGRPSYIIGMIEDISARKQVEAELANVQRQLLENVEAERLNFSQEVHDGPIQNLVALLYELTLVQSLAPDKDAEEIQERLKNLNKGLKQAVGELRDICKELRPPELERYGLAQLITSHSASFQKKHPELDLKLEMDWDGRSLPERARLALFRVYQQALANILRHAQASQVVVHLKKEGNQAKLEIIDNGKGFRVPSRLISLSHGGHLGLIGSAERIKAVGGDFQVESEPGKGTRIRAELPVAGQVKVQK
jgi:two-component system sensor histidine kinase UhpB